MNFNFIVQSIYVQFLLQKHVYFRPPEKKRRSAYNFVTYSIQFCPIIRTKQQISKLQLLFAITGPAAFLRRFTHINRRRFLPLIVYLFFNSISGKSPIILASVVQRVFGALDWFASKNIGKSSISLCFLA